MADTKISGLTALTGANTASGDLLTIVDVSDTTMSATGTNKKITLTELQSAPVSAGTANGVLYLNGSKVATSGSALAFDGTNQFLSAPGAGIWFNAYGSYTNGVFTSGGGDNDLNFRAGGAQRYLIGSTGVSVWSVAGSEQMRLTSTGLGIGTSSPLQKLDVRGNMWTAPAVDTGNNADQTALYFSSGTIYKAGIQARRYNGSYELGLDFYYALTGVGTYTLGMRLDSSGNLGLGVTPSAWGSGYKALDIQYLGISNTGAGTVDCSFTQNGYYNGTNWIAKYTSPSKRYSISDSGFIWYNGASTNAGTAITFTQAMTLDASGNLLVGTTSGNFHRIFKSSAGDYILQIANSSATTPYGTVISFTAAAPNDATRVFLGCEDNVGTKATIRSNGGIANYSANDVNLSDRREKTNFAPAGEYLSKICAIPVQTFNYIDQNTEDDPGLTLGVVAQDVQAIAPELVMESNWGTKDEPKMRLSIYQTDLQYALMKCIQEQQVLIQQLTARVAQLESN